MTMIESLFKEIEEGLSKIREEGNFIQFKLSILKKHQKKGAFNELSESEKLLVKELRNMKPDDHPPLLSVTLKEMLQFYFKNHPKYKWNQGKEEWS